MLIKFTKAHGLGNDFVIFESEDISLIEKNASFIADRKYGIGCDQVINLYDRKVKFWNSDGSYAKFCGNGCRCIIKYLGLPESKIWTDSGEVQGILDGDLVEIRYQPKVEIVPASESYSIDIGNKHIVIFGNEKVKNWYEHLVKYDTKFYNLMHLSKSENESWFMDIYECGVGPTNACGSGALAASIAIWDKEKHLNNIVIAMKGGELEMSKSDFFSQKGPATVVFTGEIELN